MTDPRQMPEAWMRATLRMVVRIAVYVALIAGGVVVIGRLRSLIATLFVATIFAYIMRPIAGCVVGMPWLRAFHNTVWRTLLLAVPRRVRPRPKVSMHAQRVVATLYVLALLFIGGWYSVWYLISPFTIEKKNVQDNWETYSRQLKDVEDSMKAWYLENVKPTYRRWLEEQFASGEGRAGVQGGATAWLGFGIRRTPEVARHIIEIVLLPVVAFYFAVESRQLKREFVGMLPKRRRREALRMIHEFNEIMFSFVVCQAILCLIAGVVVGVGLGLLGTPYPVTLGILAGLTRAIPIVGPIIGGIPIVLLAWVTKGMGVAVGVLTFFSILHFVESKFIMPLLVGDRLRLHPVVIIVVLLIGQEFAGLLGMFFAAPVAALFRVIFRRYWLRPRGVEGAVHAG
ncbi:MAG: AI-2E family transporter [Armatimonadetes bacterium]|nr:AI-2E family transporter [Armatimonadota bacterium]